MSDSVRMCGPFFPLIFLFIVCVRSGSSYRHCTFKVYTYTGKDVRCHQSREFKWTYMLLASMFVIFFFYIARVMSAERYAVQINSAANIHSIRVELTGRWC